MKVFAITRKNGQSYRVTIENKRQMNRLHKIISESEGEEKIIHTKELFSDVHSLSAFEKICISQKDNLDKSKKIHIPTNKWNRLSALKNPNTLKAFNCIKNGIEIPLDDFKEESCYGDLTFFSKEINAALSEGMTTLFVYEKI